MTKISIPQELEQEIIKLYCQGETRAGIIKKLKLPFSSSVVKRILLENGIEIRSNPGALANKRNIGKRKILVDEETQKKIIDLYVNKHYGLDKIVRELKLPFSFERVKTVLQDNNIHIRNVQEAHEFDTTKYGRRKYSINDDYCFESHNGAWLLGFITADGYLPITKGAKNRVVITLSPIDRDVLELIKQELEYTGPIHEYDSAMMKKDGGYFPMVSLAFTSEKIRKKLESYGICNNKTFKLEHLPNLSEEYMFDYIRGFIDGDGTICAKRNGMVIGATCASYGFITEMFNYIKEHLPLKYNGSLTKDHNNLAFIFGDTDSNIIGAKLYDNDYLALPRKKKKFNDLRQ